MDAFHPGILRGGYLWLRKYFTLNIIDRNEYVVVSPLYSQLIDLTDVKWRRYNIFDEKGGIFVYEC